MTLTVLLDLDDTLLVNDMAAFLPAYLQALGNFLDELPPEETIRQVMIATHHMEQNRDPSKTLEDVFDRSFYPNLGINKKDIWNKIVDFYAKVFPTLQPYTQPKQGAVELVDHLFSLGHRVIIATNPLFPQPATAHRLEWAGIPIEKYPFALVSTYERFHFSKPDPAYYAELLAQVGWPPDPIVMIGDDYKMDILPASNLGIPAFWVRNQPHPSSMPDTVRTGEIAEVIPWLNEISASLSELHFDLPQAQLAVLRSTPAALDALTRDFTQQRWRMRAGESEWSPTEIVCHLRDVDQEVNWPRLQKVITEENPFLPGVATDPWAQERQYHRQDGVKALSDFIEIRGKITDLLHTLQPVDWHRLARHAIFGPTQLKELTSFIATHDRVHVNQIYKTVSSR